MPLQIIELNKLRMCCSTPAILFGFGTLLSTCIVKFGQMHTLTALAWLQIRGKGCRQRRWFPNDCSWTSEMAEHFGYLPKRRQHGSKCKFSFACAVAVVKGALLQCCFLQPARGSADRHQLRIDLGSLGICRPQSQVSTLIIRH